MKKLLVFIIFLCAVLACYSHVYSNEASLNVNSQNVDTSKSTWWYGGMAKEKYDSKDYNSAIQYYNLAIQKDVEVAEFYYYRAHAYILTGRSEKAISDYKKALELNPDYLTELTNIGWSYLLSGNYRAAINSFFEYLKLMRSNPKRIMSLNGNTRLLKILNELGWEALRVNDLPRSLRYFNSYLHLAPKNPDVFLGLSLVYYKYNDYENALYYLDEAKSIEPTLYKGAAGIATLEKKGSRFSRTDMELLQNLFGAISNKIHDLQNITTASTWKLLVGFMYLVLGMLAFVIFGLRFHKNEGFIAFLGLLNISFGITMLHDNPLIQLTALPSAIFWDIALPLVAFIIPVAFILFIRYFIGWGWRNSILILLLFSVVQGGYRLIISFSQPLVSNFEGTSSTIFGVLSVIVLFLHMFLPDMRKNKEVQVIGAGLGFYLLAIFYNNLAQFQILPERLSFDDPAYFIFNLSMIYVAFKRISNTEKEFYAVRKDLETARSIQTAILPENNPKGDAFEISSAYWPMALIGGDYYDYQLPDKSHVGLLVADVSGHGISAALIASMLKVAFTSQVHNSRNPAKVLEQINLSLMGQLNNEFITAGYLDVDTIEKKIVYASAGHPPLLIHKRKNDTIDEIKVPGIPIGVLDDTQYNETSLAVERGDRLVMYTDGITEVFNYAGKALGKDYFMDLIKDSKNLFADDATANILHEINKWAGKEAGDQHEDDITLVIFDVL